MFATLAGGLPGPFNLGRRFAADEAARPALSIDFALALAPEVGALAAAGCPLVQVDQDDAVLIGNDEAERAQLQALFPTELSRKQVAMPTDAAPFVDPATAGAAGSSDSHPSNQRGGGSHSAVFELKLPPVDRWTAEQWTRKRRREAPR
jgi:hypothetical protein